MGNFINDNDCLWPGGRVPYAIDGTDFPRGTWARREIVKAIEEWNAKTLITLFPRGRHKDYLAFHSAASSCSSKVGKQGDKQSVLCNVSPGSFNAGNIIHEIGHALGFKHEHQRKDRGRNITIHWNNIKKDSKDNFRLPSGIRSIGNYDFGSIMHYPEVGGFAIDSSKNTITPKISIDIGQREELSSGDIRTAEVVYGRMRGNLLWYRHNGFREVRNEWRFDYGRKVGSGWQRFRTTFASNSGVIYGVERNGDLKWYRHRGFSSGSRDTWVNDTGVKVGSGWQRFQDIFAAPSGVIYAVEKNGDLKWYKHRGFGTGANEWASDFGKKIGSGWQRFTRIFASSNGVIYAIERNGDLKWYKHLGSRSGRNSWATGSGKKIGSGWQRFKTVFATSNSTLYAVEKNGDLRCYRHLGTSDGSSRWTKSRGTKIGTGWHFNKLFATNNGIIYGVW